MDNSLKFVERKYPRLAPLVRRGVLRVSRKPAEYDERRRERRFWKGQGEPREPETIFVLGTCHVSEASAADVREVIEAVRPQAVVVELCKKRSGALNLAPLGQGEGPEDRSASGALASPPSRSSLETETWVERTTKWILRKVLSSQADRIGRELNVVPGVEFRQAVKSARDVDAEVVLGDRPIDITLKRCWVNLTMEERLKLALVLASTLVNQDQVSREVATQISTMESELNLDLVFEQVTETFPGLVEPLFKERDRYMAWTLKRSKAVTNCTEVVGVIGKGHLESVLDEIEADYADQHLSFKRVARLKY
ncbi:TraB domain-containing protein [Chloropicon primus]|uniref:TraB domain-containing protein n=1 Tax=Chloropicon primus TaxID=1764295 RepID=A0A5B8N1D4_9CHLO|nr:TraB domain-containing protein [Chloropicon primus]UPR05113.1 TraB domain-containing protein [Chloropicon primus]|mmetsp:Transcript_9532/g.27104  ORF Transcript_9532/g.27104 Transcript_9532/m.27104 type:complete len:310 (+) Transcript_9532:953-1882(+)|eukprot:QDZ25912.1 TraB domain-containing protein [Chloropicon primus]